MGLAAYRVGNANSHFVHCSEPSREGCRTLYGCFIAPELGYFYPPGMPGLTMHSGAATEKSSRLLGRADGNSGRDVLLSLPT